MVFRFGNGIFEPIWNRRYVDHVQITVAEDLGVEGRGAVLRGGRRQPRHPAEPHAAAAQPGGHGAAHRLRGGRAARREAARAAGDRPRLDRGAGARTTSCAASTAGLGRRQAGPGLPRRARGGARLRRPRRSSRSSWRSRTGAGPTCRSTCGPASGSPSRRRRSRSSSSGRRCCCSADATAEPEPNLLALRIQPDEGIMLRFAAKVPGPGPGRALASTWTSPTARRS